MANILQFGMLSSISDNMKTDNIVLDSIIIMIISSVIMNIGQSSYNILDSIKYLKNKCYKKKCKITYNCKKDSITYEGKALMFYIKESNLKNLSSLKEIQTYFYDYKNEKDNYDSYLVIDNCSDLNIYEDIYLIVNHYDEEQKGTNFSKKIPYCNFIIYTKKNDINYLTKFIKMCKKKYEEHLLKQVYKGQLFFNCKYNTQNEKFIIKKYNFHTNKNFDNIFFDNKKIIQDKIDFFIHNKEWYAKRGIPYTMGILLFGEPGCGKTSFIKAILKYLNKHAIGINLDDIDLDGLQNLILNEKIQDYPIKQKDRIYIFEDIDCMGDIVKKRNNKNANKDENKNNDDDDKNKDKSEDSDDDTNIKDIMKKMSQMVDKKNINNLSKLLNIIDGLIETPGRIIIMTTNHPEKLDKALIRPGRIDIKIHFKKCSKNMIKDILNNYYDSNIDINYLNNVAEFKHTPAELIELCSYNNLQELIKKL